MGGRIRVGISGWTYDGWRGTFYPAGLPHRLELAYAAERLSSIEINGTFYSLQKPESYAAWAAQAPEGFVFAVKAPRYITHIRRLRGVETPVANFMANGLFALGGKLGPLLWQLPPTLKWDRALLADFLALLPRDTDAAAALARSHDSRVERRLLLEPGPNRPLRHALEVRHESFMTPEFPKLLEERGIALVTADTAGKWPLFERPTADFAYARLHGDEQLYVSGYTPAALRRWARLFARWRDAGRDVYVYFDNDAKVRAPYDARSLMRILEPDKPFTSPRWETLRVPGKMSPRTREEMNERIATGWRRRAGAGAGARDDDQRRVRPAGARAGHARPGRRPRRVAVVRPRRRRGLHPKGA